jgi:hypothetical protein
MRAKILGAMTLSCCLLGFAATAGAQITYHGGPVIVSAKVVNIFWGPSFVTGGADFLYAQSLIGFRNQFGTNHEYNVITQYYQVVGGVRQFIQLSNLAAGTTDWFDTSLPPANVTDTIARNEIRAYLATHAVDASTIYQLFLPASSYSSFGTATSCGGPGLSFCAYHSTFSLVTGSTAVKYAVQPYESCSACQVSGWSAAQNEEHFVAYTTRASVTDPLRNAWYDNATGIEMDDKCLWSPAPFLDGGLGYPYEWSNLAGGCVKWR